MKIFGIIVEINPLHNGHIHFIKEAKKIAQSNPLICITSGNFVQRGEVSCLNKFTKAQLLIDLGVNLVIELPFVLANQGGEFFAYNSVKLLDKLQITDLIFGSESNDIALIAQNANLFTKNSFEAGVNSNLQNLKSNDILGISYMRAIKTLNPDITCHTVQRINNAYNDLNLNSSSIQSATAIRQAYRNNESIADYLPITSQQNIVDINDDLLYNILKVNLRNCLGNNDIIYLSEQNQLLRKLEKYINNYSTISELCNGARDKNNSKYKLQRVCMNVILNIYDGDYNNISYLRVLAVDSNSTALLRCVDEPYFLNLKTNTTNEIAKIELRASQLFDLVTNSTTYNQEFNKHIMKEQLWKH